MINKMILELYNLSNGHIITNSRIKKIINDMKYNIDVIEDSRSATFFAFGESKICGKPSILIIDEVDASSAYTGLTEAYYQNVPIFVILISNHDFEKFWDFCIEKKYSINEENNITEVCNELKKFEIYNPILLKINMKNNYNKEKMDLSFKFENYLEKEDNLFIYNIDYNTDSKNILIENKSKYGIISRYVGYIQYVENKNILVCREKDLELDVNIFNSRYVNNKFKVIIISENHLTPDFRKWIECNKIKYIESNEITPENFKEFINYEVPSVLMIKGGK